MHKQRVLKVTFNQLNAPSQLIQDDSGVTTSSSIANLEQPSVQSQQIKSLQQNNGIGIQQKRIIPIDIILSQLQQSSKTSQPTMLKEQKKIHLN